MKPIVVIATLQKYHVNIMSRFSVLAVLVDDLKPTTRVIFTLEVYRSNQCVTVLRYGFKKF